MIPDISQAYTEQQQGKKVCVHILESTMAIIVYMYSIVRCEKDYSQTHSNLWKTSLSQLLQLPFILSLATSICFIFTAVFHSVSLHFVSSESPYFILSSIYFPVFLSLSTTTLLSLFYSSSSLNIFWLLQELTFPLLYN